MTREVRLDSGLDEQRGRPGSTIGGPWKSLRLELQPDSLRQSNVVGQASTLEHDGSNLSNVLQSLGRRRLEAISQQLCELIPLFSDVDVRPDPSRSGAARVVFTDGWMPDVVYEPSQVSDGTMLVLAFLTLGHLAQPPDLLTIESPEHSLHPYLLGQVVELLRSLSEGELGTKATQVVVATHSAELLEFVTPEEVRFVSRDLETGETRVEAAPTASDAFRQAWDVYEQSLGELWLSGGLGGVPAPVESE